MTREEAIDIIKCLAWHTRPNEENVEQAIKALEQELNEDCISRYAVERVIKNIFADYEWQYYALFDRVKSLPPVQPKPKTGHWEWIQYDSNPNIGNWHCSECRTIIPHMPEETDNTPIYKWCPMCGARMD